MSPATSQIWDDPEGVGCRNEIPPGLKGRRSQDMAKRSQFRLSPCVTEVLKVTVVDLAYFLVYLLICFLCLEMSEAFLGCFSGFLKCIYFRDFSVQLYTFKPIRMRCSILKYIV